MPTLRKPFCLVLQVTQSMRGLAAQVMSRVRLRLRAHTALAAEHLFLQKQVALYQARNATSRRDLHVTRLTLVWLSYWCDWQPALTIVQPETFKRWRRQGWRLVWKTPSKLGRPPIPPELQALIRRMARENLTWGQQRIANELLLKLGLRVSPRTVRKYMPSDCVGRPGKRCPSQRWSTFIRNHAKGLIDMDVTAEVARKAQGVFAPFRRLIQSRLNQGPQRASIPVAPQSKLVIIRLDDCYGMPGVAQLYWAASTRRVERSPPERRSSQNPESIPATQTRLAARVEVRSALPVYCRQGLTCCEAEGVASALNRVIRSDAWPRVA